MFKYKIKSAKSENSGVIWKLYDCELTDQEYDDLKSIISFLGGCWRQKEKCFVFKYNPEDILNDMFEQFEERTFDKGVDIRSYNGSRHITSLKTLPIIYRLWQEKLQYYPTPTELVEHMISCAELTQDDVVLEPSAGQGSIAKLIKGVKKLYLVEPDEHNCKKLRDSGFEPINSTFEDFCAYQEHEPITKIIMNPPFSEFRDCKHVMMAYDLLTEGGILIAIISENNLFYDSTESVEFRQFLKEMEREEKVNIWDLGFGAFQNSGTMVYTRLIKLTK